MMGDKIGRIHLGRQDLSELQTRKMKGLKRGRDLEEEAEGEQDMRDVISDGGEDVDVQVDGGVELKRIKMTEV